MQSFYFIAALALLATSVYAKEECASLFSDKDTKKPQGNGMVGAYCRITGPSVGSYTCAKDYVCVPNDAADAGKDIVGKGNNCFFAGKCRRPTKNTVDAIKDNLEKPKTGPDAGASKKVDTPKGNVSSLTAKFETAGKK